MEVRMIIGGIVVLVAILVILYDEYIGIQK